MHTVLGLLTMGWMSGQASFLPDSRLVVVKGNIADILGRPVALASFFVRSQVTPAFNLDALLSMTPTEICTDAAGQISTNAQNQFRVLRSTSAEDCYVRITIPVAGADWVVRMPSDQNAILLKDLVERHLVVNLGSV